MSTNSQEVTPRAAVRKARARRRIHLTSRTSRPWRFELSTGPIKLAFTLALSVAAGAVLQGHLKRPIQHPQTVHRAVSRQEPVAPPSLATLVEGYAGLALDAAASESKKSKKKGPAKSSSHVRTAVAKALVAPIAANPNSNPAPAKPAGGLHSVGRGVKHVGGFLTFRHKKDTTSSAASSSTTDRSESSGNGKGHSQ